MHEWSLESIVREDSLQSLTQAGDHTSEVLEYPLEAVVRLVADEHMCDDTGSALVGMG